jgi:transaldolase
MTALRLFLDTASVVEVTKYLEWGVIDGLTTNQKIFAMEKGISFEQRVLDLCSLVSGPVSVETTSRDYYDLVQEGRYYSSLAPNVVVKVAMYRDGTGLRVLHTLASEGIKTNATTLMTAGQALLAAKAGATYVSLFFRRIRDAGGDPEQEIRTCAALLERGDLPAQIIAGSIREPQDVVSAAASGAHVITIPPPILEQMPYHPKTEETIEEFDRAWIEFKMASAVVGSRR